ncbi:MAG TPA: hypothetical protein EYG03_16060 [Planctomycetes bacterium]|nr:hypothetical protein [Fuerstiella sp.]HIK93465.1 hypothetical protein [Planctomycetota bacterium]
MEADTNEDPREMMKSSKPGWRRAVVATSVLGGMLFSGAAILPTAVMRSTYRDTLLNTAFSKYGLTASSAAALGGWLTPVSFQQISLSDEAGQIHGTIRQIHTSISLFSLLTGDGDLGTITLIEPELQVALDEDGKLSLQTPDEPQQPLTRNVAFEVVNGGFQLSVPWRPLPIVDIDDLDIAGAVTNEPDGRWLSLDPVQIFAHEPVSEAHTEQNLALIAPVLSQSTALSGKVSVMLHSTRIQLNDEAASRFSIRGAAVFHTVNARLKQDWVSQISQLVGQVSGNTVPDRLEIARNSTVDFKVDSIGIHHSGLAFLLPEIADQMRIESSGMVGLDETLDLSLQVQLPLIAPSNPFTAFISKLTLAPIALQVKGTVSDPKLIGPPILDELSKRIAPEQYTQQPADVTGAVMQLLGTVTTPDNAPGAEGVPGGIIELIRSIKKAREDAPPKEKPARRQKKRKRTKI